MNEYPTQEIREEQIKNCPNCQDSTYRDKYLHYCYFDKNEPSWSCGKHPNYYRESGCITSPTWIAQLQCTLKEKEEK